MYAEVTRKIQKILEQKVMRLAIIGFLIFLVLGAGFWVYYNRINSSGSSALKLRTTKVAKGNFTVTVSGSGPIVSSNRVDVSSKVEGTISKVYFKEGDAVKAGDLMFELDDYDAQVNAAKMKATLAQNQMTLDSNQQDVNNLNVTSPYAGYVSNIQVKKGDILAKNAPMFTITDSSKLKVLLPFSAAVIREITTGKDATVYIPSLMGSVQGRVSYISSKSYIGANGAEVYGVEITMDNPGSLKDGMKASAEISTSKGPQSSTDSANMEYVNAQVVRTTVGGTVNNILVKENQHVKSGELLIQLTNDDAILTNNSNSIKVMDSKNQYDLSQTQLTYYKVYAPIDGTIVKQNTINPGDNVKAATVLATIADITQMEFSIPIDELDISKIKTGQKVNVTVDALPDTANKPLAGEVSKIAVEGTYTSGVTTYPVTVKVMNPTNLRGGMNANAEILVANKQNALYLPAEAVTKFGTRYFAWVKNDGTVKESKGPAASSQPDQNELKQNSGGLGYSGAAAKSNSRAARTPQNTGSNSNQAASRNNSSNKSYYANAVRIPVEVGITNDTNVEILSGLKDGDEVILPPLSLGQSNNKVPAIMPMGGGGGAPAGGVRGR